MEIRRSAHQAGEAGSSSAGSSWSPPSPARGAILQARLARLVNVMFGGVLLVFSATLILASAAAIWLDDRGLIFYRQKRVGLCGRPFELMKFRSMRINNLPLDDVTEIRAGHPLVTPVGKWIRRFKIDELPQLLNVLRGDMALIGPRPGVPEHLANYTEFQRRRLSVRPGLTGWAQVNGGIELTWAERIMLDIWYIDHRSFWIDLLILWQTVAVILFGEKRNPKALQEAMAYATQLQGGSKDGLPRSTVTAGGKAPARCRIVHLTSVHQACDLRIFHKECRSLAAAGYDVTVIGPGPEPDTARDGVTIRCLPRPQTRLERMTRTVWRVYRTAVRENADIYHFHDPELMPVGVLLKAYGKRVIYDVHEEYGLDMLYKQWIPTLLRPAVAFAIRTCEVASSAVFDGVVAASPTIARKFPPRKTRLVRNFPWINDFGSPGNSTYEHREHIAVYVGGLSDERGMREMRRAVELAAKEIPIKLVVAGKVNPGADAEFLGDRESELVEYVGQLTRSQVGELLSRARVGLFLLHPLPSKVNALPIKLFEYMLAGLPVVVSDFPDWRQVIDSVRCGLLVDPLKPESAAEALVWLFHHPGEAAAMGQNGQRAVVQEYNWERESENLVATYAEL